MHNEEVNWFDARSICLKEEESDLAIFEDAVLMLTFEWQQKAEFWIGLRKESWSWKTNQGKQITKYYTLSP